MCRYHSTHQHQTDGLSIKQSLFDYLMWEYSRRRFVDGESFIVSDGDVDIIASDVFLMGFLRRALKSGWNKINKNALHLNNLALVLLVFIYFTALLIFFRKLKNKAGPAEVVFDPESCTLLMHLIKTFTIVHAIQNTFTLLRYDPYSLMESFVWLFPDCSIGLCCHDWCHNPCFFLWATSQISWHYSTLWHRHITWWRHDGPWHHTRTKIMSSSQFMMSAHCPVTQH